ncbi:MAG TPA: sugar phosphate isomerase/epimerase [Planctomycetaceae bacterium]|nr:sugar phosphate isomerase/epimerase [Planctomycetaceae bacterium]
MGTRREVLGSLAVGFAASMVQRGVCGAAEAEEVRSGLGLVIYCCSIRQRLERGRPGGADLADPLQFLKHARRLGAGGIQTPLGARDRQYTARLRSEAERWGMFIEAIGRLPSGAADVERFEAEVRTARHCGAQAMRVVMLPGRRYEQFTSMDEYRRAVQRGVRWLELAEPVARRHGVPLAVENHKDQRVEERLEVLRRISSRYVGACVDTGNSFALLEDPLEVVEAYAPWCHSVHLKDQAVQEYEEGFLFADVPPGEGFLPLKQMGESLRRARPGIRFCLEIITRDPLEVPCLKEAYWTTLADVPGRDLARTLRTIRARAASGPLPRVSELALDAQAAREEDNVKRSLRWARDELDI